MATADRQDVMPNRVTDARGRLIPRTPEQLRERNAEAIRALDDVAEMGTEEEQAETLAYLKQALGPDRTLSERPHFR